MRPERTAAAAYAVLTAALWPVPVFGLLHAESSAVVAAAGFFVSGLTGVAAFRVGERPAPVLIRQWAALGVPLAMLTLSVLWRPNCAYATGLGYFVLVVPPSVALGVGAAYALVGAGVRRAGWALAAGGVAVALVGTTVTLLWRPQFFVYNPIYGGVLGPIYDEELAFRPGLLVARSTTLLWAVLLFAYGRWRRGGGRVWVRVGAIGAVGIGGSFVAAVPLGTLQSQRALVEALGATGHVGPVVLHYDPDAMTPAEVRRAADEATFRYAQIERQLGVRPAEPVEIFLYPSPDVKGALLGSRTTSVTPVWLPTPQVHMLASEVPRSLAHELAHVFAREFGAPVLRASPAVGLVEGLAVALEPPDGAPDPTSLVAASRRLAEDAGALDAGPGDAVRATMSPIGFWTARPGVAYVANGSFVEWLLDRHGQEPLRTAYRTGRWRRAYGVPLDTLTARWEREVSRQPVSAAALDAAAWTFRQPSLFESVCPHHVPPAIRLARRALDAQGDGDWTRAAGLWDRARAEATPGLDAQIEAEWGRAALVAGRAPAEVAAVLQASVRRDTAHAGLRIALADAFRLAGRPAAARRAYVEASSRLAPYAVDARVLLALRAELAPALLRALLSVPAQDRDAARRVGAGLAEEGALGPRVFGALLLSEAGEDAAAWDVAQSWTVGAGERAGVLRGQQARLAYRAGQPGLAERLAADGARRLRSVRQPDAARVLDDWADRARWRREGASRGGRGGPTF